MNSGKTTRRQPDLRTEAIVLRRTDYGEADRILQLLTPEGKRSVIAKGVRKEKSKLAGGIELFSVSEVVIHEGKTELGVLTSAKLMEYYDAFVKDIELIEMGGAMMKSVSARAEQVEASSSSFDGATSDFEAGFGDDAKTCGRSWSLEGCIAGLVGD